MESYKFERAIVEILTEIIESKGLRHEPLAEQAWPDQKDAGRAWQDVRNKKPPRKLAIRDAYAMAKALGLNMSALCGIAEGRIITETLQEQASALQNKQ